MSRYSYTSLSSQDFEELVRDLLQAEWKVALEAFRTGRDKGIDLRYTTITGSTIIVQCKHYVGSTFSTLLSHLKKIELPKIKRLSPARYALVTSVSLSPDNKTKIRDALQPYIKSDSDVLGAGDLDGLLSKHSEIERDNFKLWMTNTNVIERVLHNAKICRAEFVVERIRKKIPRFVQVESYSQALGLLSENKVLIVSGVPGIGKTTLAEMLLFGFLEQGYQPIVMQGSVSEGLDLYRSGKKQIFYFDDFLGQFFLGERGDYFGRNQDAALVDFIEMIRKSEKGRFILTTREHLLQSANSISERFSQARLLDARYVLELSDYSRGDKARILYNHLYFSDLPETYRKRLLKDDFFFRIIGHEHFNPRLVEWLSSYRLVKSLQANEYQGFVMKLLDSPHELWRHAFEKQLSSAAQDLLLALYSLDTDTAVVDLEPVWLALHEFRSRKYNRTLSPQGIRPVLQELDGAFLSFSRSRVSFLNPSIREFVASVIMSERSTAADLMEAAVRFRQIVELHALSLTEEGAELAEVVSGDIGQLTGHFKRLLETPYLRWEPTPQGSRGYPIDSSLSSKLEFMLEINAQHHSLQMAQLILDGIALYVGGFGHDLHSYARISLLKEIYEDQWFMAHGGSDAYRAILDALLDSLEDADTYDWINVRRYGPELPVWTSDDQERMERAWQRFITEGLDDLYFNCSSREEYSYLLDGLSELSKLGFDFTSRISSIAGRLGEIDEEDSELESGPGIPPESIMKTARETTDEEIREMFHSLNDPISSTLPT